MPYKPTLGMSRAAKAALKNREKAPKSQKAGTPVGVRRASQYANRETVSLDTVKRTYSYLSRAKPAAKRKGPGSKAHQAYNLWGGDAALAWSRRILKK